ncbi:hypothetical protein B4119_1826 [Parageobacillus caldoxylosilyticus]|uniref:Uncharacterized protein n=1 Tax=Saccharococcus caldoxylosilyticus TaxID=81408 RepID=A0A150LW01_9BACL|nr:hypothetical protein B4119_1826 [Parageobacillus caldoxylosilyticus]
MFHRIPPFPLIVYYCYRSFFALLLFGHKEKRVPPNGETR